MLDLFIIIIDIVKMSNVVAVVIGSGGSRKNILGEAGPSSFGRQQRLSEITIEPIKNLGAWARFWGLCPRGPNLELPLVIG